MRLSGQTLGFFVKYPDKTVYYIPCPYRAVQTTGFVGGYDYRTGEKKPLFSGKCRPRGTPDRRGKNGREPKHPAGGKKSKIKTPPIGSGVFTHVRSAVGDILDMSVAGLLDRSSDDVFNIKLYDLTCRSSVCHSIPPYISKESIIDCEYIIAQFSAFCNSMRKKFFKNVILYKKREKSL